MGATILQELSRNEQERIQYENELIYELDHRSGINRAREEGLQTGANKKAIESAKAAIGLGLTLEQASIISGLSIDEIQKYQ